MVVVFFSHHFSYTMTNYSSSSLIWWYHSSIIIPPLFGMFRCWLECSYEPVWNSYLLLLQDSKEWSVNCCILFASARIHEIGWNRFVFCDFNSLLGFPWLFVKAPERPLTLNTWVRCNKVEINGRSPWVCWNVSF